MEGDLEIGRPNLMELSLEEAARMRKMADGLISKALPPECPPYRDPLTHELLTGINIPMGQPKRQTGRLRISRP